MSLLDPLTWDFDFFLLRGSHDRDTGRIRKERIALSGVYLATLAISALWLALVTKYVPEAYLDEVFHIPQAQAYCRGELHVWDPKLTTPPGLYLISTVLIRFIRAGSCTVLQLRATNSLTLSLLLPAVHRCRRIIISGPLGKGNEGTNAKESPISWDAVHTAVNICLFPLIFFFSGLYYTDVLSTFIVIKAYEHFLNAEDRQPGSVSQGTVTFLIGLMALLMRQTNIFWVAVFMGGLELARCFYGVRLLLPGMQKIHSNTSGVTTQSKSSYESKWNRFNALFMAAYNGTFHDPKLEQAGPLDYIWCAVSLGVAMISNPRSVVSRLWPYVALLLSFTAFVLWNGGVVLGDKSNHVATIHLPQMLYIWPFMALFSLPLLLSNVSQVFFSFLALFKNESTSCRGSVEPPQMSTLACLLLSNLIAIGVIHLNTIIHPFTLADNRHYVFYVFRYTIRRHAAVKYLLAPVYVICAFFVLRTLAGYCFPTLDTIERKRRDGTTSPSQKGYSIRSKSMSEPSSPSTSFTLIWFISTALSLITAPLVEPRYFIIPWVMWRLHVPTQSLASGIEWPAKHGNGPKNKKIEASMSRWPGWMEYWVYEGHDYRLWLETIWFLVISFITGSIFLFKGFEWPQEPDNLQRFMW